MTVFSRLYNIARARLPKRSTESFASVRAAWNAAKANARSGASGSGASDSGASGSGSYGSDTAGFGSSGSSDGEGARDPKLAGAWANLELPYGSSLEEVEKAWKRLSRMYHPDRHAGDPGREQTAKELMQGINQARETLRRHLRRKG